MKILLAITVCEQNKERIVNQLALLSKHAEYLKLYNITPLFVYGNTDISVSIEPHSKIKLDVEERYTNLYKKIFCMFEKCLDFNFDYLIKIDDDTLFNINLFDPSALTADYIGRFMPSFTENAVHIFLPTLNIYSALKFYPKIFKEPFKFATGDLYILSRRVVEFLAQKKDEIFSKCREQEYVCEDQLVGFCIKDIPEFTSLDITYTPESYPDDREETYRIFQITKNLMSFHPIYTEDFLSLMNEGPEVQEYQLINDEKKNASILYRTALQEKLRKQVEKYVLEFINHKKIMGMG